MGVPTAHLHQMDEDARQWIYQSYYSLTVTFTQEKLAEHMFSNKNYFSVAPIYLLGLIKSQSLLFMVTLSFSSQPLWQGILLPYYGYKIKFSPELHVLAELRHINIQPLSHLNEEDY